MLFWRAAVSGPSLVFTQLFRHFVTVPANRDETTWPRYDPSDLLLCRSLTAQPVCVSHCVRFDAFVWIIWWFFKLPNMVMLRYVSLCFFMLRYVSLGFLCFVMFRYVSLCFVMFRYVSLCFVMFRYVSLCFVVSLYFFMFRYVSLCFVMFRYVSLCFVMFR